MCSQPMVQAAATRTRSAARLPDLLGREAGSAVETCPLKVSSRQYAEAIEGQKIGGRAQLSILGRCRAEGFAKAPYCSRPEPRLGPFAALRAAHRDRFHILAAEHGAAAATSGVAAIVRNRRITDKVFAGGTDRRPPDIQRQVWL